MIGTTDMRRRSESRNAESGYNLVEVLIATAMTGVVALSIMTLFFLARRNVYSGKQLTAANSVLTRVLEDLSAMSSVDVLSNFNVTNSTTLSSNSVAGVTYAGSVIRDSSGTVNATTDPSGYMGRWQTLLTNAAFANARLVLVITPTNPADNARPVSTAQAVRVRAILQWDEGMRRRNITVEASKLQRP